MTWFSIGFPIVMILAPLGFALVLPSRAARAADPARARRLMLRLVAGTIAALLVFALLWWAIGPVTRFSWFLFFPLFFGLAMPLIVTRDPAWGSPHTGQPAVRSATLVNRSAERIVPPWVWVAGVLIAMAATAAILARPWGPSFDDAARRTMLIALAVQVGVAGSMLVILAVVLPRMPQEAEPLDAQGSPELLAAYASLRRFRTLGLVILFAIVMNALVGASAVAMAWVPRDGGSGAVLGLVGGIAGSLVGLAGAVFGTMASVRRARINRMLMELEASHGSQGAR